MLKKLIITALVAVAMCSCKSKSEFSNVRIDVGLIVKDAEKSVKFYKEVIGMTQTNILNAPESLIADSGLSTPKKVKVYFMALDGADNKATQIKIMKWPGSPEKAPNKYVDSSYGFSYITIFVKDADKVVANLKKHNIPILGKGPFDLGCIDFAPNYLIVIRDPDGNFIELIGPMKKK